MGYIPNYDYDIFISYAHVDNLTTSETEKGWVKQFHDFLRVKLSQLIGRDGIIKIWWDESLDGNQLFDEVIKERINKSVIFVTLTSFGYLESEYCQQELVWFHHKAQSEAIGLNIANRSRIVNVLLYNIHHEEWPRAYGRATGFKFHGARKPEEIGEPCDPTTEQFKSQLRKLSIALMELLKAIAEPDSARAQPEETTQHQCDVYLAEVTDTLRDKRKRLVQRLTQKGITVHQKVPPPYEAQPHERTVIEALENTTLSVHLLDHLGGADIENETGMTYPRKQAKLGLQYAQSQLVWVPRDLEIATIEDEQQRVFLEELENDICNEQAYDFLRGTADEVYQVILDKLEEVKANAHTRALAAALLDTHEKDEDYVLDITRSLLEKDIIPYINPLVDDPRTSIDSLKDRLRRVNAVVIVYGIIGREWVIARFEEIVKIVVNEKIPIKSFCIYLAPPEKDLASLRSNYSFLNPRLLDNQRGFNPASLKPLYKDLGIGGQL